MIIDTNKVANLDEFRRILAEHEVQFFDFGCSQGGGTSWVQSLLNIRGLGFDIDPDKLKAADAKGILCCAYDILKLPQQKLVSFTTLFHMLEHLSSVEQAKTFVQKACAVSSDAVIIKQPFYDTDPQLFRLGLKTFYSHWTGHRNQMTSPDFYFILAELHAKKIIRDFAIGYKKRIESSDSPFIHPLESPINCHEYDPAAHPPKPTGLIFDFPLYYEIQIAIDISGNGYGKVWTHLAPDEVAYDTKRGVHALSPIVTGGTGNRTASSPLTVARTLSNLKRVNEDVRFYLRDDDFVEFTKQFNQLELVAKKYKNVLLATIPGNLKIDKAGANRLRENFAIAQHGYTHTSHAIGNAKNEFPDTRARDLVENDLKYGKSILENFFGAGSCRHFVSPWNRFSPVHYDLLEASGFESYHGTGTIDFYNGLTLIGYCINFTALYNESGGSYEQFFDVSCQKIDGYVKSIKRKTGADRFYIPINTHHLMMNDTQFAFLEQLLQDLEQGCGYRSCSPEEAISYCMNLREKLA